MTPEDFARLGPLEYLQVKFGTHGTQLAQALQDPQGPHVYVRKFLARSKRWTGPVKVHRDRVISRSSRPS